MPRIINKGYQTWDEFVAKASRRLTEPTLGTDDATKSGNAAFYGAEYREALRMAKDGWPAGASQIAQALDSLNPPEQPTPEWNLEVAGAFPCVPEYLTGSPECMFRQTEGTRPDHRLTLVVPTSYPGAVRAHQIQNYAAAIAAITRMLETQGISVAIYRVFSGLSIDKQSQLIQAHAVREHGEPLDLGKIAFAFHPAMFRRLNFAWWDVDKEAASIGLADGLRGRTMDLDDDAVKMLLPDLGSFIRMPDITPLATDGSLDSLDKLISIMRESVARSLATMA